MRILHWPTFFCTIIVYILLLILFVSLRLKMPLDCDFKKRSVRSLIREARTGDIIAIGYGSKRAKLVKIFTGSMWAHSCVVVKTSRPDSEPYVLEVARYSAKVRGIMVTKLSKWLKRNSHHTIAISQYQGPEISDEQLKNFLSQHEGVKEQMFVLDWLAAMIKRPHPSPEDGLPVKEGKKVKFFCSELVCHFLQEMNIVKKKYHPSGYKPWELLYGKLPLCEGIKYRSPYLVSK